MTGECLRSVGRSIRVVLTLLFLRERMVRHDLAVFSQITRQLLCTQLETGQTAIHFVDGKESRVSPCLLAVARPHTRHSSNCSSVHRPSCMTLAGPEVWRWRLAFVKSLDGKERLCSSSCASIIHAQQTQWPDTTTRRGRGLPRESMPRTKRLPAPPSTSASQHRATNCTRSSVCACQSRILGTGQLSDSVYSCRSRSQCPQCAVQALRQGQLDQERQRLARSFNTLALAALFITCSSRLYRPTAVHFRLDPLRRRLRSSILLPPGSPRPLRHSPHQPSRRSTRSRCTERRSHIRPTARGSGSSFRYKEG